MIFRIEENSSCYVGIRDAIQFLFLNSIKNGQQQDFPLVPWLIWEDKRIVCILRELCGSSAERLQYETMQQKDRDHDGVIVILTVINVKKPLLLIISVN